MDFNLQLLLNIRTAFIKELDQLSLEQLNYIPASHSNNIIWNIGHSLVIQQLICYSLSNLKAVVEKNILKKYKNGSIPEGKITQEEVDLLKRMLIESVDLLKKDLEAGVFKEYKEYTVGFGTKLTTIEDAITFNNAHEALHYGYVLSLKKITLNATFLST
jgi:hypothetical protein